MTEFIVQFVALIIFAGGSVAIARFVFSLAG